MTEKNRVVKNYSADLAKKLVTEVNKYLDEAEVRHGADFSKDLLERFICTFIGFEVHKTLTDRPDGKRLTKKEEFDFTSKNFADMKVLCQEAISGAFSIAMTNYSGQSVEYYCQIKAVPPPINKEPC